MGGLRSLILFYRLCQSASVFYHLFSFPPPQLHMAEKKDINLIQRPVGGTGRDGAASQFCFINRFVFFLRTEMDILCFIKLVDEIAQCVQECDTNSD